MCLDAGGFRLCPPSLGLGLLFSRFDNATVCSYGTGHPSRRFRAAGVGTARLCALLGLFAFLALCRMPRGPLPDLRLRFCLLDTRGFYCRPNSTASLEALNLSALKHPTQTLRHLQMCGLRYLSGDAQCYRNGNEP